MRSIILRDGHNKLLKQFHKTALLRIIKQSAYLTVVSVLQQKSPPVWIPPKKKFIIASNPPLTFLALKNQLATVTFRDVKVSYSRGGLFIGVFRVFCW